MPLWFLGVYAAVVALVPVTIQWHRKHPVRTLVAMAAVLVVVDVIRFAGHAETIGDANTLFVFAFVHQLGYAFGDGTLASWSRRCHGGMVAGAVAVLSILTIFGPYAHSMVAVDSERISNMMPPNACIAALGVLQAGLALLVRPALNRWLGRRGAWKLVVRINAIAMTIFTWHMTAYVIAVGVARGFGVRLLAHRTWTSWLERPLCLPLPAVILAGLVVLFFRYERIMSPRDENGRRAPHGARA